MFNNILVWLSCVITLCLAESYEHGQLHEDLSDREELGKKWGTDVTQLLSSLFPPPSSDVLFLPGSC